MEVYGDEVIFATIKTKVMVVCFKGSGFNKLIQDWQNEKLDITDYKDRLRLVETVRPIIRQDISLRKLVVLDFSIIYI